MELRIFSGKQWLACHSTYEPTPPSTQAPMRSFHAVMQHAFYVWRKKLTLKFTFTHHEIPSLSFSLSPEYTFVVPCSLKSPNKKETSELGKGKYCRIPVFLSEFLTRLLQWIVILLRLDFLATQSSCVFLFRWRHRDTRS